MIVAVVVGICLIAAAVAAGRFLRRGGFSAPKTDPGEGGQGALYTYEWVCPKCGTENITHNTEPRVSCGSCGMLQILDMEPWACACGQTGNQGWECFACGTPKPEL